MSEISQYVEVSIDRATKTPSQASFNIPGVIGQFATTKTITEFDRARSYRNLKALVADGWSEKDSIYNACAAIWRQSPTVTRIIVGRLDSLDTSIGAGLNAIAESNGDWYGFVVVGLYTPTVTLSTALVTGNVISTKLNGIKVPDVTFATSAADTMEAWATAIETAFPGSTATVTGNSLEIEMPGNELVPSVSIAGGASQPKVTVAWAHDIDQVEAIADWVETQKKGFVYDTTTVDSYNSSVTTDIFSKLKAKGYDRSLGLFHKNPGDYAAAAWLGEFLPYDPGSSTYAYRTLKGVPADNLGTTKEDIILTKNGSYYTTTAGISHTFEGKSASGEFFDVIVGIDWIEARIKERIFGNRVNTRKVPLSDPGLEAEGTLIKGTLREAERMHILVEGSSTVTVPKAADISTEDKAARYAPGFEFGGNIEGAIHKSKIVGHLSV